MTSKQCTRPEKCPSSCSSINSSQSSLPENSLFSGPIRCNYAKLSAGWFGDTLVLLLPCYKPLVLEKWKWKLKDVPLDSIDPLQLVRPFYSHEAESISVWGWVEVSFFFFFPSYKSFPFTVKFPKLMSLPYLRAFPLSLLIGKLSSFISRFRLPRLSPPCNVRPTNKAFVPQLCSNQCRAKAVRVRARPAAAGFSRPVELASCGSAVPLVLQQHRLSLWPWRWLTTRYGPFASCCGRRRGPGGVSTLFALSIVSTHVPELRVAFSVPPPPCSVRAFPATQRPLRPLPPRGKSPLWPPRGRWLGVRPGAGMRIDEGLFCQALPRC